MNDVVIARQFQGPPNLGNGGYVGGLMAEVLGGSATVVIRAPIPIETLLRLDREGDHVRLLGADGVLLAEGTTAREAMTPPPAPPSAVEAEAAGKRFIGLGRQFHPICFCCTETLAPGYGLRVFVGQTDGAPEGHVSGLWSALAPFGDVDGLSPTAVIWAAIDCPGSVAWAVMEGDGGMLGTMSCEVLRRPRVDEACIITAWPVEQSGRKRLSGTALFTAEGELLAQSRQVWIKRSAVVA